MISLPLAIILGIATEYLVDVAHISEHPEKLRLVASCIVCVLVMHVANYLFERRTARIIEALRRKGTIPPEGIASDADILRMVKEGKREEAAYCYKSLHKGAIEKAQVAVGINGYKMPHTLGLWLAAFGAISVTIVGLVRHRPTGIWAGMVLGAFFCIMFLYMRRTQRRVDENRSLIDGGILPAPHSFCPFRKR